MSDTTIPRRAKRVHKLDPMDVYHLHLIVPASINKRALAYFDEFHPHLSQIDFWIEAMIFYLDAKGAERPPKKN